MKQILFILAFMLGLVSGSYAAQQWPVTGRVVDAEGAAVEFANVIFMRDSVQVGGVASAADGSFAARLPEGSYKVRVQYLGYETLECGVEVVAEAVDCGELVLRPQENRLGEVVVEAPVVRREADRFVVDVANALSAVGKDGVELLQQAPGVWIDNERIMINGKSGSKVYVDGRELRMEKEQMLMYLRSLQASDIQRIEVVPQSGADHDADSSGGIIMITTRRRRDDGMMGSVSFLTNQAGRWGQVYRPSLSIDYHKNRLNLYARMNGYFADNANESVEDTDYSSASLHTHSQMEARLSSGGATAGAIYELTDRHSIGGEFGWYGTGSSMQTDSESTYADSGSDSRYIHDNSEDNWSATLNYVWKIDTLGSTFKILSDYTRRISSSHRDNRTVAALPEVGRDSLYRDDSGLDYGIFSVTAALEKRFSPRWQLRAGAKFTRNDLHDRALYEYLKDDSWVENTAQSRRTDYAENIGALYAVASASLGRWSVVAGLRGEYTAMLSDDRSVDSRYLSLFPNANLSYLLTADGSHMLIAQYSRTISRPGFGYMSPARVQISEYSYMVGNPDLRPSYSNKMTLSYVLKSKYTFSASADLQRGLVEQQTEVDPSNPMVLRIIPRNFGRCYNYTLMAVLPFTLTKWWSLNANLVYLYSGQNLPSADDVVYHHTVQAQASTDFTLPRGFVIEAEYTGLNRYWMGNTSIGPMHRLTCRLKKRMFDNRLTAMLGVENVLNNPQYVRMDSEDFHRVMRLRQLWDSRTYTFRITYNFKAGKSFRNRSVESGAAEEKSRL